ncbi:hypothetical protein L1049_027432 [Liquidambar formosana]|uniref:CBS domain-containing protein n=1 Tax=Liquidambar formosana TaxID=63359 RepID=A0AAP0RH89_LIQFO
MHVLGSWTEFYPMTLLTVHTFQIALDLPPGIYQVSLPSSMHHETLLQLSDCDVSRCHLSMHLSKYTAYELLPKSGKVTLFVVEFSVKKAFHIMRKLGHAIVPLWDDRNGQLSGMLTASDFISMLMEHYKNSSLLPPQKFEMLTISAWKKGKIHLHRESVGATQPLFKGPLLHVSVYMQYHWLFRWLIYIHVLMKSWPPIPFTFTIFLGGKL